MSDKKDDDELNLEDVRPVPKKRQKITTLEEAIIEIDKLRDRLDRIEEILVDFDIEVSDLVDCCHIQAEIDEDKKEGKENE